MLARRIDFNLINKFTCLDNAETQSLFSVVKMRASHVFARLCSIKLHRNENRLRCSQLAWLNAFLEKYLARCENDDEIEKESVRSLRMKTTESDNVRTTVYSIDQLEKWVN